MSRGGERDSHIYGLSTKGGKRKEIVEGGREGGRWDTKEGWRKQPHTTTDRSPASSQSHTPSPCLPSSPTMQSAGLLDRVLLLLLLGLLLLPELLLQDGHLLLRWLGNLQLILVLPPWAHVALHVLWVPLLLSLPLLSSEDRLGLEDRDPLKFTGPLLVSDGPGGGRTGEGGRGEGGGGRREEGGWRREEGEGGKRREVGGRGGKGSDRGG